MKHRTQLYLEGEQYRWLQRRAAGDGRSIAAVVREMIDEARTRSAPEGAGLISYLLEDTPGEGAEDSTVETLDDDLYGPRG